jgi:creatinine amidohydrolase
MPFPSRVPSRYWADLATTDFAALDAARTVAVLPVAATEQHGPHLPLSVDQALADGVVAASLAHLPADLPVLFLPTQAVGYSPEHTAFAGTLTLSAPTLIALWTELGESVARAGVKKLVLFNSHGGQVSLMDIVARELRNRCGLMVVAANWYTLGLPAGMFDTREIEHGIHAGDLETSIMMALTPQDVRADRRQDFHSLTETLARENRYLSITPRGKIGWQTQDLNPQGACGDATKASADKGHAVIDFVSSRFVELLQDECSATTWRAWTTARPGGRDDGGGDAFVFQEPTLMPWATVADNVWLPLRLAGAAAARRRSACLRCRRCWPGGAGDFAAAPIRASCRAA